MGFCNLTIVLHGLKYKINMETLQIMEGLVILMKIIILLIGIYWDIFYNPWSNMLYFVVGFKREG